MTTPLTYATHATMSDLTSGAGLHEDRGDADSHTRLLRLINASWTTQALGVVTALGVPDFLGSEPRSAFDLARAARCDAPSLLRLLRALTSIDVLRELEDGRFALTGLGSLLRPDVAGSLAAWAVFSSTQSWSTWQQLEQSVRTGSSVRKQATGVDGFLHLDLDPVGARLFHRAMVALTEPVADAFARGVKLAAGSVVVDVGGGYGQLIAKVLARQQTLRGVVFDLPHAIAVAGKMLEGAGVADRCRLLAGDFFEGVPDNADAYLLKSVLHDWDDAAVAVILRNCRRSMREGAALFIIERIAPERYACESRDQDVARSDLNMLVATGGRERTAAQYQALLDAAGLQVKRSLPLYESFSAIEAAPKT